MRCAQLSPWRSKKSGASLLSAVWGERDDQVGVMRVRREVGYAGPGPATLELPRHSHHAVQLALEFAQFSALGLELRGALGAANSSQRLPSQLLQHSGVNRSSPAILCECLKGGHGSMVVVHEGRLLWVPFGKTRRSKRALEVPDLLTPYLLKLAEGRAPEAQLFGGGKPHHKRKPRKAGRKRDRYWVLYQVKAMCTCTEAKVPKVCAHSLRGMHATLATDAGATPHLVAQALGHGSIQVAEMHYTDRTAAHSAKTRRVMGRLGTDRMRAGTIDPARMLPESVGNGER